MTPNWSLLKKPSLCQKPALSQGTASYADDRQLELTFVKLQELEENSKKLYKEVKRSEDCLSEMHKAEERLASDLCNSLVCQEDPELKEVCDKYVSVVYQIGHGTEDLIELSQRTVVDPMKKLSGEFPHIQAAIKRRDQTLGEVLRAQQKLEKQQKMDRTGQNIVKTAQMKKGLQLAKEDFEKQNRLLVMELPEFYEKRVDYAQPCLQSLIFSQVDYYGESTSSFSNMIPGSKSRCNTKDDALDEKINQIKALSIVG